MDFKKIAPNLIVDDLAETMDFYRFQLGFTIMDAYPFDPPFDWAILHRDEIEIRFRSKVNLSKEYLILKEKEMSGAFSLFIRMKGIREFYDEVKSNDVSIISDLKRTYYGTEEFAIQDCNGFILTFAESME